MPKVKCQRAAARGQPCRASCLQLLLSTYLLLLSLGQSRGAINIPKDYVIDDLKQPPVITFQTESYTVFYLDDVMLKCEAMGNPSPTYRWVKDGEIFREESLGPYHITANDDEDLKSYQGKYRCYASNELGTAISDVIELITEPMPILPKEKRVKKNVSEGESVVLHCNLPKSSVAPTIHWMDKKLLHISQSERVTTGLDGNLFFANTLVNDSRDDYTCHAQYIEARTILPKEPISLTVNPSNQVQRQRRPQLHRPSGTHSHYLALRGQSLTLECIPHGHPTPTVVWEKKDGSFSATSAVSEKFNRWLTFYSISENDDGEYSCTASNTLGKVTHSYTVTVQAAPYWSKQPQNHRYAPGETVRLDCQAEGIPTPNITWRINGVPIQETDEEPRRSVSRGTLILTNVRYDDTAVYQCEASNQHGTSLINIYIHIIELPPQILTPDVQFYKVTEGATADLNCSTFGSPPPQISWENQNMETVLSDPRMSQLTNGTLRITDVRSEDTGLYNCSVKHSNLSISAFLEVYNRTQIVVPPQNLEVERGSTAVLWCSYLVDNNMCAPLVLWRTDGNKTMNGTQDKHARNSTLRITDVKPQDAGKYHCEVISELDKDSATGSITVVDKPDPPHSLQLSEKSSRSVTLSWTPGNENNSPVSEFVIEMKEDVYSEAGGWKEVEQVSPEINHLELPLLPFCTYHFRVAAVNKIGTSDYSLPSESYTTPAAKPHMNPKDVKSNSTDPGSMVITWKELERKHFNGPGFQYKVWWRQAAGKSPSWNHAVVSHPPFIVNGTETFSAFEIKVQAVNDKGEGPSPLPAIGHSGEDYPLDAPTGVTVTPMDSTTVKVTWKGVSRESVRGHLKGYMIYLKKLGPRGGAGHERHGKMKRELGLVDGVKHEGKEDSREILVSGDRTEGEILSGLEFYSNYELSITVLNNRGQGPPSDPAHFSTPEGAPGPPSIHRLESKSETELTLYWRPPRKPNGVLRGYELQYQEIIQNSPSTVVRVPIDDAETTHQTLRELNPRSFYIFTLRAFTNAGGGDSAMINATTLLDGEPPTIVEMEVGERSVNLSWVPGHRHRNIVFNIHYLKKIAGAEWEESELVNSTQAFYQLQGLRPGTEYIFQIRLNNFTYWNQELRTNGPDLLEVPDSVVSQGWFIGLISALVLLLLILLILCFIKRSKGGKYSVKDKEEGRVDSDIRPIKDETVGEYSSDNDEKRSISQPSLGVESKRGSDDSLAEYGDSVDIQFNEDGSFIGQYSGRRDVQGHGDQESSGATSPNNYSMPPPSNSFPNSTTGILGN
ncbi:neural cell adhesion molecule L1.1 [Hoplias malabaricus]|uniref:neural cell adhesion molecule L1.1 n=1 Tax=Hoplias malabaricus TaxID=27720 RepID=UPI0034621A23